MPKLLNLQDADTSGFKPLEPNRYNAEVFEIKTDATKNEGKTPIGTPMIRVQFKLTDPEVENRRVFTQFVVPPKDYDKAKASKMNGMIARFFMALGDPEDKVLNKDFDPDFEDYIGRPCVVVVGKEQKKTREGKIIEDEWNNPVKGIKPAGTGVESGNSSGLL